MKTKTEDNNVVSEIIVISDGDESELLGCAKDESVIIIDNDKLACDGKDTEDTEISDYTPAPQGRSYTPTSCAHSSKASKGLTDITTNDCDNKRKRKRAEMPENKIKKPRRFKRLKSGYFLKCRVSNSKLTQKDNVADSQDSSSSSTSQESCSNAPSTSSEGVTTTTQSQLRVIWDNNNPSHSSTTTHVPQAAEYSSAAYDHSERESNSKYRVNCPVCQSHAQFTGQKCLDFYYHILATHLLPCYVCKKCNVEFQGRTNTYNCEIMQHYQRSSHKARCPWCEAGEKERSAHRLSSHCRKRHLLKIPTGKQSVCPHETCGKVGTSVSRLVSHYLTTHERSQNLMMHFTCAQCGQKGLKATYALEHYINNHSVHFNEEMLDYLLWRFSFWTILNSKRLENISPSTVEQPCQPKDSKVTLVEDVRANVVPNGGNSVRTNQNVASASSSNAPETTAPTDTKELNTKELNTKELNTKELNTKELNTKELNTKELNTKELNTKELNTKELNTKELNTKELNTKELNLPCGPLENLSKFSHIIFVDLDNWGKFFDLPYPVPSDVFVWGFLGGFHHESRKYDSPKVQQLLREKRFFKHPKCGKGKNAADFALCVQAARLDLQLPIHIPFTVLSGDKGFNELTNQLASSARSVHLVDPHYKEPEILTAILKSIGEK